MSLKGQNTKSIRKKSLSNTKQPIVGVKNLKFQHKATAGETVIDLTSLIAPVGFVNPSPAETAKARIKDFQENVVKITSSDKGELVEGSDQDYIFVSNTTLRLIADTILDEVIEIVYVNALTVGALIGDVRTPGASGTLLESDTDFNLGEAIKIDDLTNDWPIQLFRGVNGKPMTRNTANGTSGGNYQMIDNGSGYCQIVRFNIAGDVGGEPIMWANHGALGERPNLSVLQQVDSIFGTVDIMKTDMLEAFGFDVTEPTRYDGAPTNVDLKTFGDRVLTLEKLFTADVPIVTEWASFTPTGTFVTNATYTGVWRRVGDTFEAEVKLAFSGATTGGFLGINLPFSLAINTAKITDASSSDNIRGDSYFVDLSLTDTYFLIGKYNTTTNVQFPWSDDATKGSANLTDAIPVTIASGDYASIKFSVPIAGWDSTQTLAQQLGL